MLWKKILFLIFSFIILISCGAEQKSPQTDEETAADDYKPEAVIASDIIPLNFNSIKGTWDLRYGDNYGYQFRLGNNYRAVVILFLSNSSIIFRGVYTIENDEMLRINISEMKREERVTGLNTTGGFTQVKSSYFLFHSRIFEKSGRPVMELRPVRIFIDDSSSEGFFEPLIRLTKQGK